MDRSQRWLPGKAPPIVGNRLKLVAVIALVVSATGYAVFEAADSDPSSAPLGNMQGNMQADSGCEPDRYAANQVARQGKSACASVAPDADDPPVLVAAPPESDSNSHRTPRHASSREAERRSAFASLRPGYTLAELCAAGVIDKQHRPRCQTGSYDGQFTVAAAGHAAAKVSGKRISGQVLTADGEGLGGVRVIATPGRLKDREHISASGELRFWTLTDALGAYTLDGLPDGEYMIRSGAHGQYQSARISARAGVNYADLVLHENSGSVLTGQVLSSAGEPLEGVTVLPVLLGQSSVITDYDGYFQLPVLLQPGINSLALRFHNPGFHEQSAQVWFNQPDATDLDALNVIMQPVDAWTAVNGTVYSDSGDAVPGLVVELRPKAARQVYTTTTDARGRYSFPVVEAPADYRLLAFGGTRYKDSQQTLRTSVAAGDADITVEAYEFGKVTGQLRNQNGEPVPDFDLVLRNTGSSKPHAMVSTDRFGNFEIPAAPAGELVLASQSTPAILVQGLQLQPGEKLHVPLVLDWGEHEISGIVVDANNNPVPASRIILQWSHAEAGIATRATRRTAADSQGHFAFSNLGPGPHSLQIKAPGFPPVDINHDLSRQGYDLTVRLN